MDNNEERANMLMMIMGVSKPFVSVPPMLINVPEELVGDELKTALLELTTHYVSSVINEYFQLGTIGDYPGEMFIIARYDANQDNSTTVSMKLNTEIKDVGDDRSEVTMNVEAFSDPGFSYESKTVYPDDWVGAVRVVDVPDGDDGDDLNDDDAENVVPLFPNKTLH